MFINSYIESCTFESYEVNLVIAIELTYFSLDLAHVIWLQCSVIDFLNSDFIIVDHHPCFEIYFVSQRSCCYARLFYFVKINSLADLCFYYVQESSVRCVLCVACALRYNL